MWKFLWFNSACIVAADSGQILQEKILLFTKTIKNDDFKSSNRLLNKFCTCDTVFHANIYGVQEVFVNIHEE